MRLLKNPNYKIHKISLESPEYQLERELRNIVLLRPYGLPDYGWETKDSDSFHIVCTNDQNKSVIGCLLLWPKNKNEIQLMQMAVEDLMQGQDIGKGLVEFATEVAKKNGFSEVFCHARENAIEFYLKQGFEVHGDFFEEVGIQHKLMSRCVKN